MSANERDPLRHIAEQVADGFAESGFAFVEDDRIDELAALLGSFLSAAGIPASPSQARQVVTFSQPPSM